MKRSFFVLLAFLLAFPARAACPLGDRPVVVGVPVSAPFVIEMEDGELSGFDIELWRQIASDLGCETRFEKISYDVRVTMLETGQVDAVMGGMTVNAEREKRIDFSHSYFNSGQSVMSKAEDQFSLFHFVKALWESDLLYIFPVYLLYVIFAAHLLWLAERTYKGADACFDKSYWKGLAQTRYFLHIICMTIGLGDLAPRTPMGRRITIVAGYSGVISAGLFMAAISAFVFGYVRSTSVLEVGELRQKSIAVVSETTGETEARRLGVRLKAVQTVAQAVELLENGEVDAIIFDEPDLRWHAINNGNGEVTVSAPFTQESYGIALSTDSLLREPVNVTMLGIRENGFYEKLYETYFGSSK